jgi:hypothetical protein
LYIYSRPWIFYGTGADAKPYADVVQWVVPSVYIIQLYIRYSG